MSVEFKSVILLPVKKIQYNTQKNVKFIQFKWSTPDYLNIIELTTVIKIVLSYLLSQLNGISFKSHLSWHVTVSKWHYLKLVHSIERAES